MSVRQKLSILFYPKGSKKSNDGRIPIYVRITIDGIKDEMPAGCKVLKEDWNKKTKQVLDTDKDFKKANKTLGQIKTDLERHFDLMQAKHGTATPQLVLESYKTPINGKQQQDDKIQNLAFSETLDSIINRYVKYNKKVKKAHRFDAVPSEEKRVLLALEKEKIEKDIENLVKRANTIFDKKEHHKTLVLAINEHLLNFLQLCFSNHRSPNSLEKMIGRKHRYIEFIQYRYKKTDLALQDLEYKFITDLYNYLLTHHKANENTASKYAQCIKEVIDRSVANGWMSTNIFSLFKCQYKEPKHDWLTPEELAILQDHEFKKPILNTIRDIFVFGSYTGFSYQEIYSLGPQHLKKRNDGEIWASIDRQKTDGTESVPLLPIALSLIEQYKDHPIAIRRNRLFPVPTNQALNRGLKEIASNEELREKLSDRIIDIILKGHKSRFFFANEVTYNNGVALKTVSRLLGHKSVKTTEIYVRSNPRNISESMKMVKEKLFDENGKLKNATDKESTKINETPVISIGNPLKVAHKAAN
jgi:integrase